jgi:hypothetical protein
MKHTVISVGAGLVMTVAALTGCYEPAGVTWYEAGVYKGATDPLVVKLAQPELPKTLAARLKTVQTDR